MWNIIKFIKNLFKRRPKVKYLDDWHNSALPSPEDNNDIKLGAIQELVPTPESYRIPYILRIHDQDQKPICGGETGSLMKEEKERRERNFIDFDGEWLYNKAKEIDGFPGIQGTHFRAILKVLKNTGCKPLEGSEVEAGQFKIGGYGSVNPIFDELKSAIYQYGIVAARFIGSNQGWQTNPIRPPKSGELIWGHFVGLTHFNNDYIYFQNSWGGQGIGYFGKDYLPTETWTILVDLPGIPNQLPKPKYFFQNDLGFNMRNNEVKILQQCLQFEGLFPPDQECTGYFGTTTMAAVKLFQKRYNISPQSGFFGSLSRNKMNELLT